MKVNISSIVELHDQNLLSKYLSNKPVKDGEVQTLKSLVSSIKKYMDYMEDESIESYSPFILFDNFYFGYEIDRISKEFDLLKISKTKIINIELKREVNDLSKIKKQLSQNRYYLNITDRETILFAYIERDELLYKLEGDNLIQCDISDLVEELMSVIEDHFYEVNINEIFNPKEYLVSVFNNVELFLNDRYFLNNVQQQFYQIFKNENNLFRGITGEAGTGKTLLLYHIAKEELKRNQKVGIVHCGSLNNGHETLKSKNWDIIAAKELNEEWIKEKDYLFVDEAQRIRVSQFNKIKKLAVENSIITYFGYDPRQCLSQEEIAADISNKINQIDVPNQVLNKSLTKKVRTNQEIMHFIEQFFDRKNNNRTEHDFKKHINIITFKSYSDAHDYIKNLLDLSGNKIKGVTLTKDLVTDRAYHTGNMPEVRNIENAHNVVGQEFDHIAFLLGDYLSYDANGKLTYEGETHYNVEKMIYQSFSRAKEELTLVIVNNKVLTARAIEILNRRN